MVQRKKRYYTLASLLDAQPAGLVKDPRHRLLWDHFITSEKLQKLRISRRCYNLLNQARIRPENLNNFYRTYRLPRDSFFSLFLAVKHKWLNDRLQWREERREFIRKSLENLPGQRKKELEMLAFLEKSYNPTGAAPIWKRIILPGTKKRAGELSRFSESDWMKLHSLFLDNLVERYPEFSRNDAVKTEALMMFGFDLLRIDRLPGSLENSVTDSFPGKKEILARFRHLSGIHHPDRGGNSYLFRRLITARDILLRDSASPLV